MRAMLRVLTVREKIKLTQEIKTIVSGQVLNPCKVPDAGCLNKLLLNAPRDLRVENLDKMWVQKLWY